jgi:hypothetical protein
MKTAELKHSFPFFNHAAVNSTNLQAGEFGYGQIRRRSAAPEVRPALAMLDGRAALRQTWETQWTQRRRLCCNR